MMKTERIIKDVRSQKWTEDYKRGVATIVDLKQQLLTAQATISRLEREKSKLLRMDEPYTLYWTLFHLQAAVKHLFEVHQCDQHGHEVWHHVAYEKTDSLLELLQTTTSEQKEGE